MAIGTFTNLGNFGGSSEIYVPAYEGFVEPTGNGLMDLMLESAKEFYQLNAALYVADVVHEQATLESTYEADIILENVVKDTITKLKELFMKMWSKVKAWFASVIQRIKMMLQSGEKFISSNKKKLEEKNVLGFKYTGYKWTIDAAKGKANEINKELYEHVKKQNNIISQVASGSNTPNFDGIDSKLKPLDEEKEDILKSIKVDELSEIRKEIFLAARNGQEEPDEIEDFSANPKSELISLVKDQSKTLKEVEKVKKENDKLYNDIIKTLDKASKDISREKDSVGQTENGEKKSLTKAEKINLINRATKLIQYLLTINSTVHSALVDSITAASKEALSVLKKYLTYKPAKESFGFYDDDFDSTLEGTLIDQAMKLV